MSEANENQNVMVEAEKVVPENVQIENKEVNTTNMNGDASTSSIELIQGSEEKLIKEVNNIVNNESIIDGLNSKTDVPLQEIKEIEKDKLSEAKLENQSENIEPSLLVKEETNSNAQEEWVKRESALLEKISMLEKMQEDNSNKGLKLQLQVKCEENDILKAKCVNLETELNAVLKKPNGKNKDIVSKIKKQHDELLTKARGMIFDKTKMIKNQELQIEALTSQVASLKDVVSITKDLLSIRNLEVTHLQERLQVMDMKIQAEKERHNLMSKKIESGTRLNEELKKEYTTQLALFKELKVRYEEKFRAMEEKQNETPENSNGAGPSSSNDSAN